MARVFREHSFLRLGLLACGLILSVLLVLNAPAAQATQDLAGAEDPLPEIRDPTQVLVWQSLGEAPERFDIPLGPMSGLAQINDWARVAGPVSRSYYTREGTARRVEVVFRRQREVLERSGFEIRTAGYTPDRIGSGVGARRWLETYLGTNPLGEGGPPGIGASAEAQGVIIATREEVRGTLWAVVSVYQPDTEQIGMLVDLVQTERAAPPPPIGGLALARMMASAGHAVLDGISFTDDGALDPSSEPVLAIVGRYLRENLRQSFRVVGHSDDTGSLAEAERRSQAQAEAVVTALVERHGAARDHLRAFGVGPLAPLFPNESEAGRARNRRVELVVGP